MSFQLPPPADCEAIRQVLYRYCRGIDRCDRDTLVSCYWPEAIDDHASWVGQAHEFVEVALPACANMAAPSPVAAIALSTGAGTAAIPLAR